MKDYSYLEGRKFTFNNESKEIKAKVLYADYDVGITCVNASDPDHYLLCLLGPSAPGVENWPKKAYQHVWSYIINQIKSGYVNGRRIAEIYNKHMPLDETAGYDPTSETCAFAQ